uniref:hypothetical protein n=1 Tax=Symbiochloris sp. SG-2018 TaxID=2126034 RepID=UPI00211406AB|nr:hypothetical protein NRL16_pgp013 [Symbiochloris sp. SG-2018]UTQ75757.1 hypothetical protein [Symbiochloris sp. SG-2018]
MDTNTKKEVDIMNCTSETLTWENIDWETVGNEVKNLQTRIFVAKQKNDRRQLRRLQKLLFKSHSNRLIALRRVLIYNDGKKTLGIDKTTISKKQRIKLYYEISKMDMHKYKPLPVKRIKNKLCPLGIPTIKDHCIQAMVRNCLEPEWEAVFESTSYGFRPGRSHHDALARIYTTLSVKKIGNNRKNWVLDANIESFFDNVDHNYIFEQLDNFPMKHLIYKWLKSGHIELSKFNPTDSGISQGGIISPLLANIVLTDLAKVLKTEPDSTGRVRGSRVYVRYADNFVVLCSSLKEARKTHLEISTWLKSKGLKTTIHKTRIVNISDGFDFLGINIRQYETKAKSKVKGKILLMRPSKIEILNIKQKLKSEWSFLRGKSITTVLNRLNPKILGWRNYFRKYVSVNTFRELDNWTYLKAWNYASRMHPNKGKRWIYEKYFGNFVSTRNDKWIFGDKRTGNHLQKFAWGNIQRHILVKGHNSIYDPKLEQYWEKRQIHLFKKTKTLSEIKMAHRQKFLCPVCKTSLYGEENLDKHHLIPQSVEKIDKYWNLLLIHKSCHQILHSNKDLNKAILNEFLPDPKRIIKSNTKLQLR